MKKRTVSLITTLFLINLAFSQSRNIHSDSESFPSSSSLGSFSISLPVGIFSRSHLVGAGLEYAWSHHRFGKNVIARNWIGITFNSGLDYYLGKKVKTAGNPFHYDDYLRLRAMAGIIGNPWPDTHISLTAGPVAGVYKGNTDVGLGVYLTSSTFIKSRWALGPGVSYFKQSEADALWTLFAKLSYSF